MTDVVCGAGPLGTAVAFDLHRLGRSVRVVSRTGRASVPDEVEVVTADLSDSVQSSRVFAGAATVYHCVSPPYAQWATLVEPLMRGIIDGAVAAGADVVYGDNMYCYGPVDGPLTEGLPYRPNGRGATARAAAAEQLLRADRDGRLRATIARASDFYGPRVRQSIVGARVFRAVLAGRAAPVVPGLDAPHSYTYIHDFAAALVTLGTRAEIASGQVWHVPSAEAMPTREFLALAYQQTGHPPRFRSLPKPVISIGGYFSGSLRALGERLYQTERPFVVDHTKYQEAFSATPTPMKQAIAQTLAWYRQNSTRS